MARLIVIEASVSVGDGDLRREELMEKNKLYLIDDPNVVLTRR